MFCVDFFWQKLAEKECYPTEVLRYLGDMPESQPFVQKELFG